MVKRQTHNYHSCSVCFSGSTIQLWSHPTRIPKIMITAHLTTLHETSKTCVCTIGKNARGTPVGHQTLPETNVTTNIFFDLPAIWGKITRGIKIFYQNFCYSSLLVPICLSSLCEKVQNLRVCTPTRITIRARQGHRNRLES